MAEASPIASRQNARRGLAMVEIGRIHGGNRRIRRRLEPSGLRLKKTAELPIVTGERRDLRTPAAGDWEQRDVVE
jgi:hypothetical protein